ncbi:MULTISPECIES: hypothetical protein [Enterococcus]|uniref:hypothetical protein n=1 Tax=Enterococcus TaxID=1350 RepID=UPI0001B6F28A|nr:MULTISPECIES: hypothetical protein [Enterococcus]EEV57441.1 predicted protein [Enterococcus faecium 1,231,408]GMS55388.1 hypothetical protein NUITMVRE36_23800 [Enterococcus raffinosus]AOM34914.1 hypothetical protein AL021_11075 [Enterococcus faecium]EFS08975.1 hypothetical protein HMPREF9522_01741 [Enterococcus faecium TX0082]EGO9166079.1 hypothetical protein [Enterococcus faecalis]
MNSDKTNQTLREIVACCQNIQQLIEYFGDNPTIFAQTNEYMCAVIGQCMFLGGLYFEVQRVSNSSLHFKVFFMWR